MTSVAILGAGPAGMKAALTLSKSDISVTIIDEQPHLGGQIYRNIETQSDTQLKKMGADFAAGRALTSELNTVIQSNRVRYISSAIVWSVTPEGAVHWKSDGRSFSETFDHLIIATGALERPVPVPGWTLPGVLTAGAAQILMKNGGVALKDTVLIGSGPLLYLVAKQLCDYGSPPKALLETQSFEDLTKGIVHFRPTRTALSYVFKGLCMLSALRKSGIKRYCAVEEVSIEATDTDNLKINFTTGGKKQAITAAYALQHAGVVPNTQITRSLDIEHKWNKLNHCFEANIDSNGLASGTDKIWLAGDGATILGADAAKISGELVALAILKATGRSTPPNTTSIEALIAKRDTYAQIRRFLDTCYRPKDWFLTPTADTVVCRCEEVSAQEVINATKAGAQGPNQAKAFTRCGMGNCQGRYCGLTVSNLMAKVQRKPVESIGYYRIRSPIKPITLGELADYHSDQ